MSVIRTALSKTITENDLNQPTHTIPSREDILGIFRDAQSPLDAEALARALKVDPQLWYPDAPDYYRYALSRPQMDGLLFTARSHRELVELDAALGRGGLTPDEEIHLEELAVISGKADERQR